MSEDDLQFLENLVDMIINDVIVKGFDDDSKVVEFLQPEVLKERLDLTLSSSPMGDNESLLTMCKDIVRYSVKTGHPMFLNQLYQGMDAYGLGGAWLTEALNTNCFTHEVAPVFLQMEAVLLEKVRSLIGYPAAEADSGGDGIFCPGGSISNMYALSLARYQHFPECKVKGMRSCPPMVVFTSEQSHYSIQKAVSFMGFGLDALVKVPCDSLGRMKAEDLEDAIVTCEAEGAVPVMVNATCGTTVLGAYDPLNEIADICSRHRVWMHVDACWGGGALLSPKRKHLMSGIEKSDSMAWCFHKMLGSPLQCCPFVTKHGGLLKKCHSAGATYLFQSDKNYDVGYDIGDKTFQCGRKADALKMWLCWKAKGDTQLGAEIEHCFELAEYLEEKIRDTEGFRLVHEGGLQCTNVCFWYIPQRLREQADIESESWWVQLGLVAPHVKKRMMERGSMLIGYQPLGDRPNFFRVVISRKPKLTTQHMDKILREIQCLGEEPLDQ